jgi:hypothetical protein
MGSTSTGSVNGEDPAPPGDRANRAASHADAQPEGEGRRGGGSRSWDCGLRTGAWVKGFRVYGQGFRA